MQRESERDVRQAECVHAHTLMRRDLIRQVIENTCAGVPLLYGDFNQSIIEYDMKIKRKLIGEIFEKANKHDIYNMSARASSYRKLGFPCHVYV